MEALTGSTNPRFFKTQPVHTFLQASQQTTYRDKITNTLTRLRQYGRTPHTLTYVTSKKISNIDMEEDSLSVSLSCRIRIRDARYIEMQINNSDATIAAYDTFLKPAIAHLNNPGAATDLATRVPNADRTLAVFLRQEIDNRRGKSDLLQSIADSLIIWSLSETDPDTDDLMSRDEILFRIEGILPTARKFIRGVLDHRLVALRSKSPSTDRQIRHYMKREKYCLPYETRELGKQENVEDLSLRAEVSETLRRRFVSICDKDDTLLADKVVDYCHKTFEALFEQQGLELARFLENDENEG